MARLVRVCKNCGREYETCHTAKKSINAFRWQDVACSPECGTAYFAAVLAARSKNMTDQQKIEYQAMTEDEFRYLFGDDEDELDNEPDDESEDEFIYDM